MKRTRNVLCVAAVLLLAELILRGQNLPFDNRGFSILGNNRESYFSVLGSTKSSTGGEATQGESAGIRSSTGTAPSDVSPAATSSAPSAAAPLPILPGMTQSTAAVSLSITASSATVNIPPEITAPPPETAVPSASTTTAAAVAVSTESVNPVYQMLVSTKTPQETAGDELLKFLQEREILFYSKDRWNRMRKDLEEGRVPGATKAPVPKTTIVSSTITAPSAAPLPPGLTVDLPYESQLSISGRKLIGVSLKSTIYDQPESGRRVNSTSFDMEQELQVRIKGRVGRKINVNVDFDDTKEDKRDISVVYKGDPGEVVQEAAFGDINMTLPSTEFVGYSKQLFGVKLDTKFKKLRTQGFFSRTKGLSEVKRFTGNTSFNRVTIADTGYIRLKYYSIGTSAGSIITGSVKVYQDDVRNDNNSKVIISTATNPSLAALNDPTNTSQGNFDLLVAGQDYTVDYQTGIITFRNTLGSNYLIAIDYQLSNGTWLSQTGTAGPKIIKDANNTSGITTELKTFYSLGNIKIIRDNGRGNFILKVQDLNGNTPTALDPGGLPVPTYSSNLTVDFENGIFYYNPPTTQPFPPDVYTLGTHRYNFLSEYRYRIKIISLRSGIVPQSERVTMAGKLLKRDEDYYIDYDAGIVTFLREENIDDDTVIEISYDYSPFGSSGSSTLVGGRSELSLTNNIFIGATYIYEFAARTQTVPDIRTAPTSLWVGEVDSKIQNVKVPLTNLTMSVSGEMAMSERNSNIMGKAIVDSMEGIRQEDSASLYADQWQYAANPAIPSPAPDYNAYDITWSNYEVSRKEINPRVTTNTEDRQQVLQINYNLTRSNELSIVQNLSTSGIDYSKRLYLEMWIKGDNNGEGLSVSYGTFNEDSDGNGILDTEDADRNGVLGPKEDTGRPYHNKDGTVTLVGADNGLMDTEDLNGNGLLDTFDTPASPGPYGPANGRSVTDDQKFTHQSVDWNDWRFFRIPLNITNAEDWKNIRQVRLTVSGSGVGTILVGGVTIVGNKWDTFGADSAIGSTVTVSAISNENAGYVSLIGNKTYDDLYDNEDTDTDDKVEQALRINYLVPPATATVLGAKLVYTRVYDFSAYGALKFFVFVSSAASVGDTLVFQAGGNDQNYFEYDMPLPQDWLGRWQLITIKQVGASRADHWVAEDARATVSIVGAPSLQNISQVKVGVRSAVSADFKSGEIWINEIHVADALKKTGSASRMNLDFSWPGLGRMGGATFGGSRKETTRDFETFSGGTYNRDYLEDSGYLNFKGVNVGGMTLIPFNTRLTRTRTVTPSVVQNESDLLSVLDEGRVTNYNGSGETTLNFGRYFPQLTGRYTRALTDTRKIEQLEDRESFSGTLSYENPIKFIFFPTSISGSYGIANSYYKIYPSTYIKDSDGYLDLSSVNKYLGITDYHTLEITENWALKTPFEITKMLSIVPSYSLKTVKEKNKDYTVEQRYPKSLDQNVGASSSLKLFSWFQPNFNYTINTRENYNLTIDTVTQPIVNPAKTKYIERNSSGEVTWNVQVRDLVKNRYVQSLGLTSSYRIQDSDSYDNVESTFNPVGASFDKLWIRGNPLKETLSQSTTVGYIVKSIVRKDDVRVAGKYNPFEAFVIGGRLAPLRTLSANFTYTGSEEHSYITGTQKDIFTTVWPDLIFGLNQWERMVALENWISDSQLNLKHQRKTVDTATVDLSESLTYGTDLRCSVKRKVDISLSFNTTSSKDHEYARDIIVSQSETTSWAGQGGFLLGLWRFTLRYDNSQSWTKDSVGALTAQAISNGVTALVNSDMSFPKGFPLPFTRKTIPLTNRLIFNSTLKYITKSSAVNISDNTDNYGLSSSAEYEVSKNFRVTFGLGYNRYVYRDDSKQNYTSLEANSRLTIQF